MNGSLLRGRLQVRILPGSPTEYSLLVTLYERICYVGTKLDTLLSSTVKVA